MTKTLPDNDINKALKDLPHWKIDDLDGVACIARHLTFENFVETFAFMSQVAELAEHSDHHPNWCNVYNQLDIKLSTHDAGGLTIKDFKLALEIEHLLNHG